MKKPIYLCVLLAAAVISNAAAECIAPRISLSLASGTPGTKVTVTGQYFTDGCHDVCFNGVCPPTYPAKDVKILFIQGDKVQEVGRVDANDKFEFSAAVSIPTMAATGAASFAAEGPYERSTFRTQAIPFTVTAGR